MTMTNKIIPDGFIAEFEKIGKARKITGKEMQKINRAQRINDIISLEKYHTMIMAECFIKTCTALNIKLDDVQATAIFTEVFVQIALKMGDDEITARKRVEKSMGDIIFAHFASNIIPVNFSQRS
jgi:hypothetical protein